MEDTSGLQESLNIASSNLAELQEIIGPEISYVVL